MLRVETVTTLKRTFAQGAKDAQLYYIRVRLSPDNSETPRILLGEYFFTQPKLGLYSIKVKEARDMLMHSREATVYFFAISDKLLPIYIKLLNYSI